MHKNDEGNAYQLLVQDLHIAQVDVVLASCPGLAHVYCGRHLAKIVFDCSHDDLRQQFALMHLCCVCVLPH